MTHTENQGNASEATCATYNRPAVRFQPDIVAMELRLRTLTGATAVEVDEDIRRSRAIDLRKDIQVAKAVDMVSSGESPAVALASSQRSGAPRHMAKKKWYHHLLR